MAIREKCLQHTKRLRHRDFTLIVVENRRSDRRRAMSGVTIEDMLSEFGQVSARADARSRRRAEDLYRRLRLRRVPLRLIAAEARVSIEGVRKRYRHVEPSRAAVQASEKSRGAGRRAWTEKYVRPIPVPGVEARAAVAACGDLCSGCGGTLPLDPAWEAERAGHRWLQGVVVVQCECVVAHLVAHDHPLCRESVMARYPSRDPSRLRRGSVAP